MEWIRALDDHQIVLVCPRPAKAPQNPTRQLEGVQLVQYPTRLHQRALALLSGAVAGRPLQEALYRTRAAAGALRRALHQSRPDLVVVQMVRCAWAAEVAASVAPETPILFDAIDAMALHFGRSCRERPWFERPLAREEARRCGRLEGRLSDVATTVTAVSRRDLAAMGVDDEKGRVIPVSGQRFGRRAEPSHQPTILLSGNLGYRPTVESCRWFAHDVWPTVRQRCPDVRWIIVGARPGGTVRALDRLPGVEVHGDVPSLAPFLAAAWVALAPMTSGSGVPMKVLEAWAAGVPVVARRWAAEGLEVEARKGVHVADDAEAFAAAVADLLSSSERRQKLAEAGRQAWRRWYHPDVVASRIRETVESAVVHGSSAEGSGRRVVHT